MDPVPPLAACLGIFANVPFFFYPRRQPASIYIYRAQGALLHRSSALLGHSSGL